MTLIESELMQLTIEQKERSRVKRGLKRIWAGLLAAVMACVLCLPAMAIEKPADTIRLDYVVGDTEFHLYRVAGAVAAEWIPTAEFAAYPVELNGLDEAGYHEAANTLDGYVRRDGLAPMRTGRTNADGQLTWSGLEVGLYLVDGEITEKDGIIYTPSPFLVAVVYNAENGVIASEPKHTEDPKSDDKVTYKVVKIWKDDGNSANRPQSITVELLRDGIVSEDIELNADNDWQYTWEALKSGHMWQAVEKEIKGYKVESTQENDVFMIKNTPIISNDEDDPTNPTNPIDPTNPTNPTNPTDPSGNNSYTDNSTGGGNKPYTTTSPEGGGNSGYTTTDEPIPQTGQLWWPVAPLAAVGVILISVGWATWQKGKE